MTGKWHTAHRQVWILRASVFSLATLLCACSSFTSPWESNPPPTTIGTRSATGGAASTGVPAGFYRVNPGDTLQSIAGAFGQRPQDLASWNGMNMETSVTPGQVLRVSPPSLTPGAAAVPPVGAPQPPSSAAAQQGILAWPLRGPILKRFVPGKTNGIVIGARVGETVRAAAAGRVVYAGTGIPAYGPLVIIKHNDSLITAYGQNSKLLVQEGDAVTQGQPVAEAGQDSNNVGSIQFEVRQDGRPADPLAWLPR
ncbi:peptidoglycan DD-metalloendopeptidase family protein [Paraburkholderia sp. SARCC-3016]|uniref:peptidoglycan DD-metalloendopeptidase family protein n=1 Tax=Paraburkholderia sp. SARCC-3016 TaxID=3058611 RepID=UPI002808C178|nr:peptidoglycan DD-metalloendopeptidase family protein [Paraburkholderia sp. SARCC-3016]MDQ7981824.1 peptidoglycan DD-metalloendopeptidase family protein [Paraburkholderia sp. SARCC-3016]